MRMHLVLPAMVMILSACASGGSSAATASRSRDLITQTEIGRAGAANAFELVTSLRPNWLIMRGANSIRESARTMDNTVVPGAPMLIVYLDNARLGGIETLRQIPVPSLTSLQFFDAKAATYKWGAGHAHGAILASTVQAAPPPPR